MYFPENYDESNDSIGEDLTISANYLPDVPPHLYLHEGKRS